MLMQVFRTGKGKGSGPVDYVTSPFGLEFEPDGQIRRDIHGKPITYLRDPAPVIVAGDPDQIEKLIDSLDFKYKYSSGVLSFAREDGFLSPEKEAELIEDFEKTAFAGLDKDQYAILWTRHTHQGRHELHFIIPRVELSTGKSLNAFPPNYQKYFDPWRSLHNERNGWADPDDPARSRLLGGRGYKEKIDAAVLRQGLKTAQDPKQMVTDHLVSCIELGVITDRKGILQFLEEAGLTINRQGKNYISIRLEPDAKPIRLKGVIYEESFDARRTITTENTRRSAENRALNGDRVTELERNVADAIRRRIEYNRSRYSKPISIVNPAYGADVKPTSPADSKTEIESGNCLDQTHVDRFESLHRYLFRELGADAMDYTADFSQPSGDHYPAPNADSVGEKRRADFVESVWQPEASLRQGQAGGDFWRWLHDFTSKIEGSYDSTGTAINHSIEQIISTIRDGAAATETTYRAFDQASSSINQAGSELDRAIKKIRVIVENRATELNRFKTSINLVEYTARQGYRLIPQESSRHSKIMEKDGDKIMIATDRTGQGIYFSVNDDFDTGSLIDFVQKRQRLNLGQVRNMLSVFSSWSDDEIKTQALFRPLPTTEAIQRVLVTYSKTSKAIPRYLIDNCQINEALCRENRFSSVIRIDTHGNAVFPHFNSNGLCGYELINENFTEFTGTKGLWYSSNLNQAKHVILCESGLDALSYAQINDDPDVAYASIGGSMDNQQWELIGRLFEKLAERGAKVVFAFNNNELGNTCIFHLTQIAEKIGVKYSSNLPIGYGNNWNKILIDKLKQEDENNGLTM